MLPLKLGDITLDPRRLLYVHSLRALVSSDLGEALDIGIAAGLKSVVKRADSALAQYQPDHFILIGRLPTASVVAAIQRRWDSNLKIHYICSEPNAESKIVAESMNCEVHHELMWGAFRFTDRVEPNSLELKLFNIVGSQSNYSVRFKSFEALSALKLPVFLKGFGKIFMPSFNPTKEGESVLKKTYDRFDCFAVGHQRILPLGKVGQLNAQGRLIPSLRLAEVRTHVRKQEENEI